METDILQIDYLTKKLEGIVIVENKEVHAFIEKEEGNFVVKINCILDMDIDEVELIFVSNNTRLNILTSIIEHRNTVNIAEEWSARHSVGKIHSYRSNSFQNEAPAFYKSYFYTNDSKILSSNFGIKSHVAIIVNGKQFHISCEENYIVIESQDNIDYKVFSEICYNIQVAIGFISGKFIQNEVYTFQSRSNTLEYEYRKLRPSSFSLYHALTDNAYGYMHYLGKENAEQLYKSEVLKTLDEVSLSKLVELIQNNSQIQYALVLFNESNGNQHSLLIKNNCFYAVLEVLKKFFHENFESNMPNDYTQKGNIDKFKMVFENILSISDEETTTLKKRNIFLHGDIKGITGEEMNEVMLKQITLIYRLVLTFAQFDGHIIDHYNLRRNNPDLSFIKLN